GPQREVGINMHGLKQDFGVVREVAGEQPDEIHGLIQWIGPHAAPHPGEPGAAPQILILHLLQILFEQRERFRALPGLGETRAEIVTGLNEAGSEFERLPEYEYRISGAARRVPCAETVPTRASRAMIEMIFPGVF